MSADAALPGAIPTHHAPKAVQEAWTRYYRGIEDVRQTLFNHPFAKNPATRNEAYYFFHQLQTAAFNLTIAPRQDYPTLMVHTVFDPMVYTQQGPNPDFLYRFAFLDGKRTFRIRGKRGTTRMLLIQVMSDFYNHPGDMKYVASFDLDDFESDGSGNFEIIVSATKHHGNWIPLDASSGNNNLLIREASWDWENERDTELHIELADGRPVGPAIFDENEFIRRLDGAVTYMKYVVANYSYTVTQTVIDHVGHHNFYAPEFGKTHAAAGASPAATYNLCAYDLQPDEALIVETDIPEAKYWGLQLQDSWVQSVEFVYHQSSLNGAQAAFDEDGKFRAVLSKQDPGVPNWIDPVDSVQGTVLIRWYHASTPATPTARKVHIGDVHKHLPPGTRKVTAAERAVALARRRRALLRRYGY